MTDLAAEFFTLDEVIRLKTGLGLRYANRLMQPRYVKPESILT